MDDLRKTVGQRLAEARKASGLSQQRAAELLGIDRPRLSGMENGERPVDITMLSQLAELYGVSMAYLVGSGEAPKESPTVRLRSSLAERLDGGAVRAELRGFLSFAERYARLWQAAGFPPSEPQLFRRESGSERPKFAAEGDAQELRSRWGLDDTPIGLAIFELLEDHGINVYREPLVEPDIAGAYLEVPDLGPMLFVNARDWPYRQVFTAAHELVHLIYHRGGGVSYKRDESAAETLANEFASAFLMPEAAIKQHLAARAGSSSGVTPEDIIVLHRHFGVSFAAMLVRLKRLRILHPTQYETFKEVQPVRLALSLGYSVAPWEFGYDPDKVPPATRLTWLPRPYVQLVRQALNDGRLSDRQAAKALNLDYEDWVSLQEPHEADAALAQEDLHDAEFAVR
jgi:Zn-dependent peptidase ImmA (M78 family)/DNA-binding XRE family transcriptional regulator